MRSLLLVTIALLLSGNSALSAQDALKAGEQAGPVEMTSPEGLRIVMNNYSERRGTAVLFLSTRDTETIKQAGRISSLSNQYRYRKLLVVGIFAGDGITGGEVRAFSQANGFNFPVYLDPGGKLTRRFHAGVTPQAFLLDEQGRLVFSGSLAGLEAAFKALEAGTPMPASTATVKGTPIGSVLPQRAIDDPYGAIEFSSELIFDKIPGYPVHHCSSITVATMAISSSPGMEEAMSLQMIKCSFFPG